MNKKLLDILVCPSCKSTVTLKNHELWCRTCRLAYPIKEDIPVMLENEARQLDADELDK